MFYQSKLDKFFSRLAPKRQRVEDCGDSQDSQDVFRVDALEESNTDAHSIIDEDVEESLCSGNTTSSSTGDSVHTDVVVADQPR